MPDITVVITTYNLEACIGTCFDELFQQSFQSFDVLVLDDCSKDGTVAIVQQYIADYPGRITGIFLKQNLGSPAKARNAILDSGKITGEYAIFLDGDDRIAADFLQSLYETAKQGDADIALCRYDRVEQETGRILCHELIWLRDGITLPPKDDRVAKLNGAIWNKLFRTALIREIRIPDFKVGEDAAFALRVYQTSNRIAVVPRELIHYQVRAGSIISNTHVESMYAFAEELARQYHAALPMWKNTIALASFLHIGLSMATRAADNPAINHKEYVRWARNYMLEHYDFYKKCTFLYFSSLAKQGMKGLAIWCSLTMYRIGCFGLALAINRWLARIFHKEIKF